MEQIKITLRSGSPPKKFSEIFKKQVVREYEQGLLNGDPGYYATIVRRYQHNLNLHPDKSHIFATLTTIYAR